MIKASESLTQHPSRFENVLDLARLLPPYQRNATVAADCRNFKFKIAQAMTQFQRTGVMQKLANTAFSRSETLSRNNCQENSLYIGSMLLSRSSSVPHKVESSQLYIPVNYIKPEILGMFRSWEILKIKKAMQQGDMNNKLPKKTEINTLVYDPLRSSPNLDPPTRFPRRWRQSSGRHLLQRTRNDSDPSG